MVDQRHHNGLGNALTRRNGCEFRRGLCPDQLDQISIIKDRTSRNDRYRDGINVLRQLDRHIFRQMRRLAKRHSQRAPHQRRRILGNHANDCVSRFAFFRCQLGRINSLAYLAGSQGAIFGVLTFYKAPDIVVGQARTHRYDAHWHDPVARESPHRDSPLTTGSDSRVNESLDATVCG